MDGGAGDAVDRRGALFNGSTVVGESEGVISMIGAVLRFLLDLAAARAVRIASNRYS